MSEEVSIRMMDDAGLAPAIPLFAPRPDKKGPKTVAVLLILGGLVMVLVGFGDIRNSMYEDLSDAKVDLILENYQNQNVNITDEEYQEYHDGIKDNGAYAVRGYSLLGGGIFVIIGGILLFRLKLLGVKMAILGSVIGLIGGFSGSWMMADISNKLLPEEMTNINQYFSYLCGICMSVCVALSVLPILNASAKAALDQKVTLVTEEE